MITSVRWLVRCCYLGMFIQALVINVTPLLFIPLREQFGLSFEQIGRLVLVNFATQMVVDLVCTALADRVHPRPLIIAANALSAIGLWVFAFSPFVLAHPYSGLMAGTVIFSIGCGLLEVFLSPLINAIPSENKSAAMAALHAYYPIGNVAVIVATGAALYVLGLRAWPWIMALWSFFPVLNTVAFGMVTLPPLADPESRQTLRSIVLGRPIYLLLATMVLAGAIEVTIGQWTSAYVETALGYSKVVADLVGFLLFGIGMVIGRLWFAWKGTHANLSRVMWISAVLSGAACLAMALLPSPLLALLSTGFSGIFVSMLWPGTISLSAARFPLAGASMFALLAAAGDFGSGLMPWLVGLIADHVSGTPPAWAVFLFGPLVPQALGLKAAYLFTAFCPFLMVPFVMALREPAGNSPAGACLRRGRRVRSDG
ncbi:MAG: MFS transporter [Verrucomicrobiae bacterium]